MYESIDIIGGGIIGTTLATELLREIKKQGLQTEVHLFERLGQLGIGNTEKSIEGVRPYWFTHDEIRFYMTSIRAFQDLKAHFGEDGRFEADDPDRVLITSSYRAKGYHYFLGEKEFQNAREKKEIFDSEGVQIKYYTKEEAKTIDWIRNNFDLNACDVNVREAIVGYVHVPEAGFVSVGDIIASYRAVFEKLGGKLHLHTEVLGFETSGRQIKAIRYRSRHGGKGGDEANDKEAETKPTDFAVNAAGVWSEDLNDRVLGERLGVTPHRRIVHIVKPPEGYQTDHGLVILKKRMIRPEGNRLWLFFSAEDEEAGICDKPPDNGVFDDYFFEFLYPVLCDEKRPFVRHAGTIGLYSGADSRGWMGHYADTQDEKPLIGIPRPDRLENYAVSIGYSGHGVMGSVAAALGLTHKILQLDSEPKVRIPESYSAGRDPSQTKPDNSRL
jgi:glycine/D-amino acid oxidase-like deaminating enzyme